MTKGAQLSKVLGASKAQGKALQKALSEKSLTKARTAVKGMITSQRKAKGLAPLDAAKLDEAMRKRMKFLFD